MVLSLNVGWIGTSVAFSITTTAPGCYTFVIYSIGALTQGCLQLNEFISVLGMLDSTIFDD